MDGQQVVRALSRGACVLAVAGLAGGAAAQERRFELGLEVPVVRLSQLDETDAGFGLRLGFDLAPAVALEASLASFPSDLGDPALSGSRGQALLGLKFGRRGDKVGLFAAVRGGVTRFSKAPEPLACILIYPPPLHCRLAGEEALPTVTLGGGLELYPSSRLSLRLEAADQLLRYPGPIIDGEAKVRDGDFWDHDLRLTIGLGWRF